MKQTKKILWNEFIQIIYIINLQKKMYNKNMIQKIVELIEELKE